MKNYIFLILVLLIISIANNFIMYCKCYSSDLKTKLNPNTNTGFPDNPNIQTVTATLYYNKKNTNAKAKLVDNVNSKFSLPDNFKNSLQQFEILNPNCVVGIGDLSTDQYKQVIML